MAGLPFSGCESGRLREAPSGAQSLSGGGNRKGGTPDFGPGPARRKAGPRSARCHRRNGSFGFRLCRAGPGFGPGAAKPAGPRTSVHGLVRRNQGFGSRIPPERGPKASAGGPARTGSGTRVPNLPSGEPPGLRPCRGARRGNRIGLRPLSDSGGSGARASALVSATSKPPCANASPPRQGLTRRDSGGRQRCRPPLLFWGLPLFFTGPGIRKMHLPFVKNGGCPHFSAGAGRMGPSRRCLASRHVG